MAGMSDVMFKLKNMGSPLMPNEQKMVRSLVDKYDLYKWNIPKLTLEIEWEPLEHGTTVYSSHIWCIDCIASIKTPNGLPRIENDIDVKQKWIKLEFNYINKRLGGMGSIYGYEGYYLSIIACLNELMIVDARGEMAR